MHGCSEMFLELVRCAGCAYLGCRSGDRRSRGVVDSKAQMQIGALRSDALAVLNGVHEVTAQTVPPPDHAESYTIVETACRFAHEVTLQQPHEAGHFRWRPRPVGG